MSNIEHNEKIFQEIKRLIEQIIYDDGNHDQGLIFAFAQKERDGILHVRATGHGCPACILPFCLDEITKVVPEFPGSMSEAIVISAQRALQASADKLKLKKDQEN